MIVFVLFSLGIHLSILWAVRLTPPHQQVQRSEHAMNVVFRSSAAFHPQSAQVAEPGLSPVTKPVREDAPVEDKNEEVGPGRQQEMISQASNARSRAPMESPSTATEGRPRPTEETGERIDPASGKDQEPSSSAPEKRSSEPDPPTVADLLQGKGNTVPTDLRDKEIANEVRLRPHRERHDGAERYQKPSSAVPEIGVEHDHDELSVPGKQQSAAVTRPQNEERMDQGLETFRSSQNTQEPVSEHQEQGAAFQQTATVSQFQQAQPRYASNPVPEYPAVARRRGWEGQVRFEVLVQPDGSVGEIELLESSGFRSLDRAARRAIHRWTFHPATSWGAPVASRVVVPIDFVLESGR